jgi:small subunit ribosomal protein S8
MDSIGDFLTRIRNAVRSQHRVVEVPGSKIKKEIARILYEKGYILNYKYETNDKGQSTLKIALKYNPRTMEPAIQNLRRISSPGLRKYTKVNNMPRVMNGLGIAILSTPKGIITDKEARQLNVGGEILCYVS